MGCSGFTFRFDKTRKKKSKEVTRRRERGQRWERNKRLRLFLDVLQPFRSEHVGLIEIPIANKIDTNCQRTYLSRTNLEVEGSRDRSSDGDEADTALRGGKSCKANDQLGLQGFFFETNLFRVKIGSRVAVERLYTSRR